MEDVREAKGEDVPRLKELLAMGVAATTNDRGASLFRYTERSAPPEARVEAALDDPDKLLLAGLVEDYVVGISMVVLDQTVAKGPLGVVEELFVEDAARGVGVGEALLDAAVLWCRRRQCVGVDVAALPGDRAAKNLCERSGFRARLLVMHRSL